MVCAARFDRPANAKHAPDGVQPTYLQLEAAERPSLTCCSEPFQQRGSADLLSEDFRGRRLIPIRQLQWLVDTPEQLAQYQQLARALGLEAAINHKSTWACTAGDEPNAEALAQAWRCVRPAGFSRNDGLRACGNPRSAGCTLTPLRLTPGCTAATGPGQAWQPCPPRANVPPRRPEPATFLMYDGRGASQQKVSVGSAFDQTGRIRSAASGCLEGGHCAWRKSPRRCSRRRLQLPRALSGSAAPPGGWDHQPAPRRVHMAASGAPRRGLAGRGTTRGLMVSRPTSQVARWAPGRQALVPRHHVLRPQKSTAAAVRRHRRNYRAARWWWPVFA